MPVAFETSDRGPVAQRRPDHGRAEPMRADAIEQVLEPAPGLVLAPSAAWSRAGWSDGLRCCRGPARASSTACAGPASGARLAGRRAGEQRDDDEREEPHDVQVEPVGDPSWSAIRTPAPSAATSTRPRRRGTNATASASATAAPCDEMLHDHRGRPTGPRPRTGDRGRLVGDRVVPERVQVAVEQHREHRRDRASTAKATHERHQPSARADARRSPRSSSGASASGANLVSPASAADARRARAPS